MNRAFSSSLWGQCRLNEKSDELRQTPEEPKEDKKSSRALKPGDVVRCEIDGIGALENPVI